jgi:hypothetical protein
MRYIKLFEAYSHNHFWSELDQTEWNHLMDTFKKTYFTPNEAEEIRQLAVELAPDSTEINSKDGKKYPYSWDLVDYATFTDEYGYYSIHMLVHNISYITIYKLEDERFGIVESWGMNNEAFFECDRWDGLIETIKHIFENA